MAQETLTTETEEQKIVGEIERLSVPLQRYIADEFLSQINLDQL